MDKNIDSSLSGGLLQRTSDSSRRNNALIINDLEGKSFSDVQATISNECV